LKIRILYLLLFSCLFTSAQDKVYLMDGTCRIVKVLEISPDTILVVPLSESGAPFVNANEAIYKGDVILIEYKSGFVEIYNTPKNTSIYSSNGVAKKDPKKAAEELAFNFGSVNTLALCNADISAFYERLTLSKKIGVGCMGAYNFNRYVILPNVALYLLNNAKKNYDLGAFVNFYPGHFKRRTTFYFGLLFKYTSFSFSKVIEEKVGTSVNIVYLPAKGSQMASIVDIGTHTYIGKNFFFRTLLGIGGYKLRGDFKQQWNYFMNQDRDPQKPQVHNNFLPKIYLGLNLGFSF